MTSPLTSTGREWRHHNLPSEKYTGCTTRCKNPARLCVLKGVSWLGCARMLVEVMVEDAGGAFWNLEERHQDFLRPFVPQYCCISFMMLSRNWKPFRYWFHGETWKEALTCCAEDRWRVWAARLRAAGCSRCCWGYRCDCVTPARSVCSSAAPPSASSSPAPACTHVPCSHLLRYNGKISNYSRV